MLYGARDFSALNMQGDMSQRKTSSGQDHVRCETEGESNTQEGIIFAVLALLGIGLFLDAFRELVLIIMLLSFNMDRHISKGSQNSIHCIC